MAGIPWATSTRQVSGMELQPLSTSEREMFNQLFWSLSPVGGRVTGQQVKGLFIKSALPQHVLAHIWSLVDTDADGHIDCMQFSLSMHLVRNAMCGCPPPSALPPHILQAFVAPMPPTTTETHNGVSHMLHSAKRHSLAFEESRRANMEVGEAELTRRRAFQRQRQQEEKEREERDREQQRQRQRENEEECRRKDLEAERDRMRRDVGKLKVRHTELNGELNRWQVRKEALEQRMEEMRKDASVFRKELDSTTQMIVQLQAETDGLMEQLQRAQKYVQELQIERQSLEEQARQGKQSQSDGNQEAWGGKAVVEKQRLSLVQRFADLRVIEKQIYQSKGMEESSSMQKADHLEEWNNEIQGATGRVEKRPNVAYLLDKTKNLLTRKGTLETSNQANDSTILPRDPFLPVTSEEGSTTAWVDRNGMSSGKLGFDSHFDPFGTSETTSVNDDDSWADFSNFNTMSESSSAADKSSQRSASVPVSKANLISTKDDGLHVQATALCPFQSDQACHLSFQKGVSIMVIEQRDLWWLGESGGRRGWFPKSYVRLAFPGASGTESRKLSRRGSTPNAMADKPTQQKNSKSMMKERSRVKLGSSTRRGGKGKAPAPPAKEEKCVALYTYSSNEGGDLSFREGDVITVSKKEGDWWTGSHGGRAGIFPANHVRMLQTMETNNPSWAFGKKTGLGRVVGLYNYTAHNCDEISFSVGQVITVTKKQHSDWWEGELGGVTGLFPSNYVKAL